MTRISRVAHHRNATRNEHDMTHETNTTRAQFVTIIVDTRDDQFTFDDIETIYVHDASMTNDDVMRAHVASCDDDATRAQYMRNVQSITMRATLM